VVEAEVAKPRRSQEETGAAVVHVCECAGHALIKPFRRNGKQRLVFCPDKNGPAGSKVGNCAFDIHGGLVSE
jgi:hypothetical protein